VDTKGVLACLVTRFGQYHTYLLAFIYRVYVSILAEKLPYMRSFTVYGVYTRLAYIHESNLKIVTHWIHIAITYKSAALKRRERVGRIDLFWIVTVSRELSALLVLDSLWWRSGVVTSTQVARICICYDCSWGSLPNA